MRTHCAPSTAGIHKSKHWKRGLSACSEAYLFVNPNGALGLRDRVSSVARDSATLHFLIAEYGAALGWFRSGSVHRLGIFDDCQRLMDRADGASPAS